MSKRHTEEVNSLLSQGYSREEAVMIADERVLAVAYDEDEEYLDSEESKPEYEELDGYNDDDIDDYTYEEESDEQEELSFDRFSFGDEDEES